MMVSKNEMKMARGKGDWRVVVGARVCPNLSENAGVCLGLLNLAVVACPGRLQI